MLKTQQFSDSGMAQANLAMRYVKGHKVAVVVYWPAGIDLYPCVYGRFESVEAAMPTFEQAYADVVKAGFKPS